MAEFSSPFRHTFLRRFQGVTLLIFEEEDTGGALFSGIYPDLGVEVPGAPPFPQSVAGVCFFIPVSTKILDSQFRQRLAERRTVDWVVDNSYMGHLRQFLMRRQF